MSILRRNKIKRHMNEVVYGSVFATVLIVTFAATSLTKDKTEYRTTDETESYVVNVMSVDSVKVAAARETEKQKEKNTEQKIEKRDKVQAAGQIATNTSVDATKAAVEESTTVQETKEDLSKYKGIFVMNTSSNLNIRHKADANSEVVGILTEGNGGKVLEYGTEWTKVKSGNVKGYVATGYILIGDKAKKALKENGYTAIIEGDTVKVRAERNTDCEVLGMIAKGETLKCTKVYDKWVKVIFDGKTGYISKDLVKLDQIVTDAKSVEEIEAEQLAEAEKARKEAAANEAAANSGPTSQNTTSNSVTSNSTTSNSQSSNNVTVQNKATPANADDQYLLACIVSCEAGGESYEAKLAVANVVLNRVRSGAYPSSISGVVYQPFQFTPASNGSLAKKIANGPDAGSKKAAADALAGSNNVPGYLFFGRTDCVSSGSKKSHRVIDHQVFY
jgi:spore germination cell wall hydrolase CwlJ-like protein